MVTYDRKVDFPTSASPSSSTVISGAIGLYSMMCTDRRKGYVESSRRLHVCFCEVEGVLWMGYAQVEIPAISDSPLPQLLYILNFIAIDRPFVPIMID
jgi:hypothetical protein